MSNNLFGPPSKNDIRVGYISTDTGYITGVTICEANSYAQQNPGTTFIFRNGDNNIKYLNINEVNKITPDSLVSTANSCGGPQTVVECGPPRIDFSGGGGIGALGNVVVGIDGAILAVDVIEGGFGYQYEPFVSAKDACEIGNGAVLTAVLGETSETLETYENEADFEEYEICPDTTPGYGRNWGPNGEDLGPWNPKTYTEVTEDPIQKEIENYQKEISAGKNPFWTTRKNTPKRITSLSQSFRKYDVTDEPYLKNRIAEGAKNPVAWNEFMNSYAVSPVSPSNVPGTDFAGRVFTFEWENEFPRDGEYVFRGLSDNTATLYIDGLKFFDLGNFNGAVSPQRKTLQAGVHKIRVDLENAPIYEAKNTQTQGVQRQSVQQVITTTTQQPVVVTVPPPELIDMLRYKTLDAPGPALDTHLYTSEPNKELLQAGGFVLEGLAFKLFKSSANVPGTADVHRLFRGDKADHFFTIDGTEKDSAIRNDKYIYEGVVGKAYSQPGPDRIEVVRYFKPPTLRQRRFGGGRQGTPFTTIVEGPPNGEHFYTTDVEEMKNLGRDGFIREGIAFYAPIDTPITTTTTTATTTNTTTTLTSKPVVTNTNVFNTVDYIDKANRPLWRTNPTATATSNIIDRYGICPFDTATAEAQTTSYAGTHTIVWNNINFPVDGDYRIEIAVDDNVTLYIGDTPIRKEGFFPGTSTSTGDLDEIYRFKAGNYTIRAELEQIQGRPLSKGNPMVLAVNIETTYTTKQVISSKSWNDNPMGISITIDAPPPIVPKEIPPVQTGRCPPSPIWSTRFPGASQAWYPVRFNVPNTWSKFTNRYALSPVPPLDTPGSDRAGVNFLNDWNVEIPYAGYYGVKGTGDNRGRLLIDDVEVTQLDGFSTANPKLTKIYLTKGNHKITTEIFNSPILTTSVINKKIFSTKDWQAPPPAPAPPPPAAAAPTVVTTTQTIPLAGVELIDMLRYKTLDFPGPAFDAHLYTSDPNNELLQAGGFVLEGLAFKLFSNTSTVPGTADLYRLFRGEIGDHFFTIDGAEKASALLNDNYIYEGVVGKAYSAPGPDRVEVVRYFKPSTGEHFYTADTEEMKNLGRDGFIKEGLAFYAPTAVPTTTIDVTTNTPTTETVVTKATIGTYGSGAVKNGVTYQGPQITSYRPNTISPAYFDETGQEIMGKTFIMKWTNVDFPEDGQYIVKALADDEVIVRIDGVEAGRARVFQDIRTSFINITKGKRTIELELTNIPGNPQSTFETNPVVTFVEITKDVNLTTEANIPWTTNPVGVSAILIPPPCPKLIKGRGVVDRVIVEDPGVGYLTPPATGEPPIVQGYPVALKLVEVLVPTGGGGINYNCGVDKLTINGVEVSYTCGAFGRIETVNVPPDPPDLPPFNTYPTIVLSSETGVNASFIPVFEVIRDPIGIDPQKLIQVTDLVGLKQTGYVDGRAYYGAVFYENGVKYAGYYKTIGTPIRIYDTLQESITAKVTTPASAIERSGTDVTSNDPRLNIPGTPNTTT